MLDTAEISPISPMPLAPVKSRAVQAMNAVKFRIPADEIAQGIAKMPEQFREALRWLATHCRNRNLSKDQMAELLRKPDGAYYSYDSIYHALTGRRADSNLDAFMAALASYRRVCEGREGQIETGFIETRLAQIIWERCDRALQRQKIGYIFGESHIGKTWALKEYSRRRSEAVYMEAPAGGGFGPFLNELAAVVGLCQQQSHSIHRKRIADCFDSRSLLIIDEAHNFLLKDKGQDSLAYIRELYNKRGCAVMLSMTNEGRDLFQRGPNAKALKQLWNRRIAPLQLPSVPPLDDLNRFAAAYGLDPAPDEAMKVRMSVIDGQGRQRSKEYEDNPAALQSQIIKQEGLGVWVSILQDAADMAREQARDITWGAVIKAFCKSQAEAETPL